MKHIKALSNLKVMVLTGLLGYKSQSETTVECTFHVETVPCDFMVDVFGDTIDQIVFDSFVVEGRDLLCKEYTGFETHLKDLVAKYIWTGDTLTRGAGLLGKHQLCYIPGSEAYLEMRRCQAFRRGEAFKATELKVA
jgi:hypothetical protein